MHLGFCFPKLMPVEGLTHNKRSPAGTEDVEVMWHVLQPPGHQGAPNRLIFSLSVKHVQQSHLYCKLSAPHDTCSLLKWMIEPYIKKWNIIWRLICTPYCPWMPQKCCCGEEWSIMLLCVLLCTVGLLTTRREEMFDTRETEYNFAAVRELLLKCGTLWELPGDVVCLFNGYFYKLFLLPFYSFLITVTVTSQV